MDTQRRLSARNREATAGQQPGERAIDQQMATPVEAETVKVDSRRHERLPMLVEPQPSTACSNGA